MAATLLSRGKVGPQIMARIAVTLPARLSWLSFWPPAFPFEGVKVVLELLPCATNI
jgi:hypothetical protein